MTSNGFAAVWLGLNWTPLTDGGWQAPMLYCVPEASVE
jgi:hypothetical protein